MRRRARNGGMPGIGRPIFGIGGAVDPRKDEDGGFFPVRVFLGVLGNAERGAGEDRSIALRIVRLREIIPEFSAGERRVDARRHDRQQCEQHQEDLRKAAMEAGLTQNEPLSTGQISGFLTFEGGSRHVKRPPCRRVRVRGG
jgi:hypothetical protein